MTVRHKVSPRASRRRVYRPTRETGKTAPRHYSRPTTVRDPVKTADAARALTLDSGPEPVSEVSVTSRVTRSNNCRTTFRRQLVKTRWRHGTSYRSCAFGFQTVPSSARQKITTFQERRRVGGTETTSLGVFSVYASGFLIARHTNGVFALTAIARGRRPGAPRRGSGLRCRDGREINYEIIARPNRKHDDGGAVVGPGKRSGGRRGDTTVVGSVSRRDWRNGRKRRRTITRKSTNGRIRSVTRWRGGGSCRRCLWKTRVRVSRTFYRLRFPVAANTREKSRWDRRKITIWITSVLSSVLRTSFLKILKNHRKRPTIDKAFYLFTIELNSKFIRVLEFKKPLNTFLSQCSVC